MFQCCFTSAETLGSLGRKAQDGHLDFHTQLLNYTPNIAFGHLPPNSARFSYATEGALFISAQLSTDAVSAL